MSVEAKPKFLDSVRNQLEKLFLKNDDVKLILWNDNSVYYLDVINGLMDVLNYTNSEAYNKTMEVNYNACGTIFKGDEKLAKEYQQKLFNRGLTVTIE